jgi:hypothetical protein
MPNSFHQVPFCINSNHSIILIFFHIHSGNWCSFLIILYVDIDSVYVFIHLPKHLKLFWSWVNYMDYIWHPNEKQNLRQSHSPIGTLHLRSCITRSWCIAAIRLVLHTSPLLWLFSHNSTGWNKKYVVIKKNYKQLLLFVGNYTQLIFQVK